MASLRDIKRRIVGVKNISQVTRAMQMIAAAKMRRAQEQVVASRPYAEKAWEVLLHLSAQPGSNKYLHPLLIRRPVNNVCIILITSDRGMAGGYNTNLLRTITHFIHDLNKPVSLITVGRKGRAFFGRSGRKIIAEFSGIPDRPTLADTLPIARVAMSDFLDDTFDEVYLAYTSFVNTIVQKPVVRRLLPLIPELLAEQAGAEHLVSSKRTLAASYIYEPSPRELLDTVLPRFTELQIYQAILEAQASEHSARMVAMRSATDNANELIADLSLTYNRLRQESITKEILDIVGGVEALKK
jgi:F-type H+-transporting ATPase subunit gamma